MESKITIYSIVITLSIFAFALIAVVEMPNIFEDVLAQQQEGSQQVSSSSSSQQSNNENSVRDLDRRPQDDQRSSIERSNQQDDQRSSKDLIKWVDEIPEDQQYRDRREWMTVLVLKEVAMVRIDNNNRCLEKIEN